MSDDPGHEVTNSMGPYGCVPSWVLRSLRESKALSPYRCLAVYVTMNAIWANNGTCFPSRPTIAAEVGCSTDSVDRAIKALVAIGAMEVRPRRDSHGDPTSNMYVLHSIPWGGSRSSAATPHAGVSRTKPSKRGSRSSAATGSRRTAALTKPIGNKNASRATSSQAHDDSARDEETQLTNSGTMAGVRRTWDAFNQRFVDIVPVPERSPQRDVVEALRAGCRWEKPTRAEHGRLGTVAKALREHGATVADVERVCDRYRREWPNVKITPEAVAKHWSTFVGPVAPDVIYPETPSWMFQR